MEIEYGTGEIIAKIVVASVSLLGLISCVGSEARELDRLVTRMQDAETRRQVMSWVDENVRKKNIDVSKLDLGMSARPGDYVLPFAFDWKIIGLVPHAGQEVRLVTTANGRPVAVFFGNSRMGVLVSVGGGFGIANVDLIKVTNEVAVYNGTGVAMGPGG